MRGKMLLSVMMLALAAPAAMAQQDKAQGSQRTAPTEAARKSVTAPIDKSVDPCVDFYEYACGSWRKRNPLPGDQSRYGRFSELAERNNLILRDILRSAAKGGANRSVVDQKIGDYYGSCMDEAAIKKAGAAPIQDDLSMIDALKSKDGLTDLLVALHRQTSPGFFSYYSQQDLKDASKVIANLDQGGLGLPNRDYYFKEDAKSVETREKYVQHIARMLQLSGYPADRAAAGAKAVMAIETALAKDALGPVERRDPTKLYHLKTIVELQKSAPAIDWARYIKGVGTPPVSDLNVVVEKFAVALSNTIQSSGLEDLKTYLRWHVLRDNAPFLSEPFVMENFNFYSKTLRGAREIRPRWKRCTTYVDQHLGEALGIAYVEKTFGKDAKSRMLTLVHNLEKALRTDIEQLDWMSAATKKEAIVKLDGIANKIGYPEKWRDYSTVKIVKGDFQGNAERAAMFEYQRQLAKIGKPVDKAEWLMTPPEVNAYYDPQVNNINFPAGILQPPFFNNDVDDAVNYGAIGVVIGHELTHGFDDEGRQFDAVGNMRDWWTAEDAKAFEERASCFVNQYGNYTAVGDLKLNGKLTLGENAADNGGMRISYMAFKETPQGKSAEKIDGLTPDQRFFLGFAQVWCENKTDEVARLQAQTDPHSPGKDRANGTVSNMPEFHQAFGCKAGQPMVSAKPCRIW